MLSGVPTSSLLGGGTLASRNSNGKPRVIGTCGYTREAGYAPPETTEKSSGCGHFNGWRPCCSLRPMTIPVTLDYGLSMAVGLGGREGLGDEELDAEAAAFERGARRVLDEAHAGRLGFVGLPADRATLGAIDAFAASLGEEISDVVLLGIGGSSLGARAVLHALGGPPELAPEGRRRLHLPDNSDPWLFGALLDRLDPRATIAIVISKSGGTVETAAQLLVMRSWLGRALGDEEARSHLVLVTDPHKGSLRELAAREGIVAFDVPANVGGRFSVLSAVGLLPTRLVGLDAAGMLDGAARMAEACGRTELRENPAGLLATVHVLHHRLHGRNMHVLLPYADALRPFAAWYVQLWAESLGKRVDRQGRIVESGPTPIAAVGATDQHAQMQLFMEGPRDKIVTFIDAGAPAKDVEVPGEPGDLAYLGGKTLGQILDAELRGTRLALARDGRPSITLRMARLDAQSLGALFFLYEAATAFAGELYGIDAFDQPGVELGKRLASGLLGRPGLEEAGEEVRRAEQGRPSGYQVSH